MLFQIQKELANKRANTLAISVERHISQYEKLKQEYEALSSTVRHGLSTSFKVFLLLNAVARQDLVFAGQLVADHDYEKMDNFQANLALGRFYAKGRHVFKKQTIKYLLPLFNEKKLDSGDLLTLFHVLLESADHENCRRIIAFVLEHHSENLRWNIEVLTYQINMKHLYPNNETLIVQNLKSLYPKCKTSSEYVRMAVCFFEAGFFKDAINMFDLGLQKIIPVQQRVQQEKLFDSSQCLSSMNEVIDILELHGIKPFVAFGSLLGLVRDGKFMDYDKDADIGIFIHDYDEIFKIVSILCESSKFISPDMVNKSKESNFWNVSIIDTERIAVIDLFFFYNQSTHIEAGVYRSCAALKWAFKPFELVRGNLAGKKYWLPDNIEQHLEELYGNWREPVEVWDSLVDCPNLIRSSQPQVLYYGLLRLHNAIAEGKNKKILNYYEKLTTRWGMCFSPEAESNIKRLLQ